jgi:UDP-glucose 4-epimerase
MSVPAQPTILVTGAAGFIGSHTIDHLLAIGCKVIGVDNLSSGSLTNLSQAANTPRFKLLVRDLIDTDFLVDTCEEYSPDAIIHLAGLVSVAVAENKPKLNFRLNIEATQVIAETARIARIPRVVFASSAAVYGNSTALPLVETGVTEPASNYGNAKLMSELLLHQYARSYGITTICNRYFNVYGPRQDASSPYSGVISKFTDSIVHGRPLTINGDGKQTRDFISVHDVAHANTLSAITPNLHPGSFNICTGHSHSLLDLIGALTQHHQHKPQLQFAAPRQGDIKHSLGRPDAATRYLGFQTKVDFLQGISELNSALQFAHGQAV